MDQAPAPIDYLAWWTSIPGIPAGWPEPQLRRGAVIALPARTEAPARGEELPAAA